MRFPEFSGEWENTELQYIAPNICSGKDKPTSNGTVALYGSTGIIGMTRLASYNEEIVLVARVGANAGQLQITTIPCGVTDNTLIINAKEWNRYIYYYLQHYNLNRLVFGSGQPLITGSMLKKLKIIYGEESERNKIVNLLCLLDERIATQNKIIEKLQSLIKGLNDNIHKGIKGETVCFSDLGEAYSGLSGKGGDDFGYGEPFITYMNVYQNTYISEKDYELVQIAPNEKQNSVQYGDALFTLSSETPEEVGIGAVYLGNTQKLYLNSFCFGIHFYDERVLPQYLAHFISSSSFRRAIYPLAQGSTRFNLQKNDFMKMKFLLPSLEKQGHIANTLDALHCRLANEKSLTEQYILLKKYLLSLMFI